jgi:MFS family permease
MRHAKKGYHEIFRNKEYMKTIIASIINRFGDSIDSIAFAWLVYQVTNSAAWSAIIFGVNRIPTIFLQPIAGALVEGRKEKRIMVSTDIIRGLCVGFVATASLAGFLNQWILLICTIIISCAEAFNRPASAALIPKLLDREYYDFGLSLNTSASSAAELAGYGAAGVIIASFSISAAIYTDMVTFLLSAAIILSVKVAAGINKENVLSIKSYWHSLKDGFLYIKSSSFMLNFLIMAVFLNGILVPYNSLQAPLTSEVLHSGEAMLSVLSLAITAGMILGSAIYPYIRSRLSSYVIVSLASYSIGAFYFAIILAGRFVAPGIPMYTVITAISMLFGIAIAISNGFVNAEFMKRVREDYVARVFSIIGAVCVAAIPVVSLTVSIFARIASTEVLFLAAGLIDILICFQLCRKSRFADRNNNISEGEISDVRED